MNAGLRKTVYTSDRKWTLPRRLPHWDMFMGGDQGVMNYVILKKEKYENLRIERHPIMRWPGYASGLDGLTAKTIATKTAPPSTETKRNDASGPQPNSVSPIHPKKTYNGYPAGCG